MSKSKEPSEYDVAMLCRNGENSRLEKAFNEFPKKMDALKNGSLDEVGFTALIYAVENEKTSTVKMLLNKKAMINKTDSDGNTPLIYAAKNGDDRTAKLLLKSKADVNRSDKKYGDTPLICAINSTEINLDLVKFLVDSGAELEAKDKEGNTALDYAKETARRDALANFLQKSMGI
mmetsp:Transcript_17381/g.27777  ORF Transcript_17381/g.27777 Transcript_17381/m.27777 type:complete len:176 (-) Transcript_17381:346-873(-)